MVFAATARILIAASSCLLFSASGFAQFVIPDATARRVFIPWQPGIAADFGAADPALRPLLPTSIVRPDGDGRFAFVILLHGCGGLDEPAMWGKWVRPWASLLARHRIGSAIVDSLAPRGIAQICRDDVAQWAMRRVDDATSVRAWLTQQPFVDAGRIAVMGMSNGGRTVLSALRAATQRGAPFRAGVALYPGCQSDVESRFAAPLLVLVGRADRVAPAAACAAMERNQPSPSPLSLVVYDRAPHAFDMDLPDRTQLGMRLGYDADAADDAQHRVIDFLRANGIGD